MKSFIFQFQTQQFTAQEIHRRLHMFDTGVDGVFLCLHIGVGCGELTILQLGGVVPPENAAPSGSIRRFTP